MKKAILFLLQDFKDRENITRDQKRMLNLR